jgi:hypothetical protein
MAASILPKTYIPNWAENATNITVPLASFPELTAAEADGDTGDIRKVMYAILLKVHAVYDALPTADKPTKMVMAHSSSVNTAGDTISHFFQIQFTNTVASQDVENEPA